MPIYPLEGTPGVTAMAFNPLDHPICLTRPERIVGAAAAPHTPFALLLVDLLRPRVCVDLRTGHGDFYCAMCQGMKELRVNGVCYAVDTWGSELDSGQRGVDTLADLQAYHDVRYGSFSRLLQATPEDAAADFNNGSIDVLNIGSSREYETVSRDLAIWLPKMSERGVVILHDIGQRMAHSGLAMFWEELKARYPQHIELRHGGGLGVALVGSVIPGQFSELLDLAPAKFEQVERLFEALGAGVMEARSAALVRNESAQRVRELQNQVAQLTDRSMRVEKVLGDVNSSQAVRLIRRMRAARSLLTTEGPRALSSRVVARMRGKWGNQTRAADSDDYHEWFVRQRVTEGEIEQQRQFGAKFAYRPLISFIVPVYNPEPHVLQDTIASVMGQSYDRWELCLVDGHSTRSGLREVMDQSAVRDSRVHVRYLEQNLGISGNSNEALAMAHGEFVALLDHDDLIEPDMLYRVAEALNQHERADVVYFDEDKASPDGTYFSRPTFKPDWSPELLLCAVHPTHSVIRSALLRDIGGFDPATDGAQDWDAFLRLSEHTSRFVHIPRVLYHWRMVATSTSNTTAAKPYAFDRQLQIIRRHLYRIGFADADADRVAPFVLRLTWTPPAASVSIIIPTKDAVPLVSRCIRSIQTLTTHNEYEVILVDTGSVEQATRDYYTKLSGGNVKVISYDGEFNVSRIRNVGAQNASGDFLLFMNNDLEVMDEDWLDELLRWASLPEIGVVGAKLLSPDGRLRHAGLVLGMRNIAGYFMYGHDDHATSLFGNVDWYRDYSAVSGALHMIRREVFDALGGYDERYEASYSDVAICVRAGERGYRVLYDPFVRLTQHESQACEVKPSQHDEQFAREQFAKFIAAGDPYFNPNLSYSSTTPTLRQGSEPDRLAGMQRQQVQD